MNKESLRELLRLMIVKEVSATGAIGTGSGPIQTPMAFTGGKKKLEKRRNKNAQVSGLKKVRKDFKTENEFKDYLFEDIINKVTFGMKLSQQAKDLMDFIRGSQQHADELEQINELLKGMADAGEDSIKQRAFELYQEFLENAARDFVRLNASDMKPEEYFLKKDLLQLTYYFTQKFETPMTQSPDAIDKEPGQEPQGGEDFEKPEGEQGGEGGGASAPSGGGGGEPGSEFETPPEGEEGGEGGEGGETPPEGEEEVPPEGEEGGPPKPEDIKEEDYYKQNYKKRMDANKGNKGYYGKRLSSSSGNKMGRMA